MIRTVGGSLGGLTSYMRKGSLVSVISRRGYHCLQALGGQQRNLITQGIQNASCSLVVGRHQAQRSFSFFKTLQEIVTPQPDEMHRNNQHHDDDIETVKVQSGKGPAPLPSNLVDMGRKTDANEVTGYNEKCIQVNESVLFYHSVLLTKDGSFLWNVTSLDELTMESLQIVTAYKPKIDLFVIGYPANDPTPERSPKLITLAEELRAQYKIHVDILPLNKALGTFNILASENRSTALGVIFPAEESE